MHTLDAKININHCHLTTVATTQKNCLLLDTYNTEISLLLSDDLLSEYTLLLPQLNVQSHPTQSVGDL